MDSQRNHQYQRRRAHRLVHRAITSGKLERQDCEICQSSAHAHHDDYGLPLKVRWLCRPSPNGTDTMSQSSVMKAPKGWTDQIQICHRRTAGRITGAVLLRSHQYALVRAAIDDYLEKRKRDRRTLECCIQ